MKIYNYITLFLLFSGSYCFAQKNVGTMMLDNKAYKEALGLTTLNINKISARLLGGEVLCGNFEMAPFVTKYDVFVEHTGRMDYGGNEIIYLKMINKKGEDSLILRPKFEFYPLSYKGVWMSTHYSSGNYNQGEYLSYNTKGIAFVGDHSIGKVAADVGIANRVTEKVVYDNPSLVEEEHKNQVKAYMKYIDDYESDPNHTNYQLLLDQMLQDNLYISPSGKRTVIPLKLEKVKDANGTITEIILHFPFSDGTYPDKEEFKIRGTRNAEGLIEFKDGKGVFQGSTLFPIMNNMVIGDWNKNEKKFNPRSFLSFEYYDVSGIFDLYKWTGSEDYQKYWKLVTTSTEYSYQDKYKLLNVINRLAAKMATSAR